MTRTIGDLTTSRWGLDDKNFDLGRDDLNPVGLCVFEVL